MANEPNANTASSERSRTPIDATLHARIRAEYLEMPGMRLTLPQAARLFNLERSHCAQVLEALVTEGTIWTDGREYMATSVSRRFA